MCVGIDSGDVEDMVAEDDDCVCVDLLRNQLSDWNFNYNKMTCYVSSGCCFFTRVKVISGPLSIVNLSVTVTNWSNSIDRNMLMHFDCDGDGCTSRWGHDISTSVKLVWIVTTIETEAGRVEITVETLISKSGVWKTQRISRFLVSRFIFLCSGKRWMENDHLL